MVQYLWYAAIGCSLVAMRYFSSIAASSFISELLLITYMYTYMYMYYIIHHIAGFIGERFNLAILKKKKRQIKIPFPLETPFNIMGMHGPTTRGKIAKI